MTKTQELRLAFWKHAATNRGTAENMENMWHAYERMTGKALQGVSFLTKLLGVIDPGGFKAEGDNA